MLAFCTSLGGTVKYNCRNVYNIKYNSIDFYPAMLFHKLLCEQLATYEIKAFSALVTAFLLHFYRILQWNISPTCLLILNPEVVGRKLFIDIHV
jgi:hypothetical protein